MDWLYGILAFIVVTVILSMYSLSNKSKSWSGKVLSVKNKSETDQDNIPHDFIVIDIKTTNGKKLKKKIPSYGYHKQFPNGLSPGDNVIKTKGEYLFHLEA